MRRRIVQIILILVTCVGVVALPHGAAGAESASGATPLMGTLQELVRQLRELRRAYYTQKARDEAEMDEARRDRDLLQSQVEALREQEASLDAELAAYGAQIEDLESQLARKAAVRAVVERELAAFGSAQVRQIEAGIPYKQEERIARLRAGTSDANEAAGLSAGGRLEHLWSYAQEELRLAGSSETYSERAGLESGAAPYARYFRVGQLVLGYVTEDGEEGAVWLDGPQGGRWQAISDPKQFGPLRDAAEILDRRQAPRFVSLPIVLDTSDASEKSP